jgi:hypothetical protein
VRSIVWEECGSPEAARLKENELLRIHRPKFNVMNTYPQGYRFIGIEIANGQPVFRLMNDEKFAGKVYGAFKSGCGLACASLFRLLWAACHQPLSPFDFPRWLLAARPPREYIFPTDKKPAQDWDAWMKLVEKFFAGESDELAAILENAVPKAEMICAFQRKLQAADLEILRSFFEHGPKRNLALKQRHGIKAFVIAKEELDDLLVISSNSCKPAEEAAQPPFRLK